MAWDDIERQRTIHRKVHKRLSRVNVGCPMCPPHEGCNKDGTGRRPRPDKHKNHRGHLKGIPDGHVRP